MTSPNHPSSSDATAARDLGFGSRVAGYSRVRLINKDGSFNVQRHGLSTGTVLSPYHELLSMSWTRFAVYALAFYVLVNALFAAIYMMCGPHALVGPNFDGLEYTLNSFLRAFFFSVETFGTIGYGHIAPYSLSANIVITIESIVSLFSVALTTGLVFARFSRPTARIAYSQNAVVAPYQEKSGFMFRCANARNNQLVDVSVRVLYSRLEERNGVRIRQFTTLPLEFERVTFFTLSWTVVHPIDDTSPLFGISYDHLVQNDAEFLVLLSGIDDTFAQTVHSRTSYKASEVIWGAKYTPIFVESPNRGVIGMDLSRIHDYEAAELPVLELPTTELPTR